MDTHICTNINVECAIWGSLNCTVTQRERLKTDIIISLQHILPLYIFSVYVTLQSHVCF